MKTIDHYISQYKEIRESKDWSAYKFEGINDEEEIEKQKMRYKIGVGLFNELKIPDDYEFVSFLFDQETKLRKSEIENQEPDVLYLYAYFLSRFKNIDDIWKFLDVKYIDFDSEIGFDTNYFLTFKVSDVSKLLKETNHKKKDLLIKTLGIEKEDINFDEEEFQRWEHGKVEYYDFVKPVKRPLKFYRLFEEKELFKSELKRWIEENELDDRNASYELIHFAEYAEDKELLIKALESYLRFDEQGFLHDKFSRELEELKNE